ncbi:MAG: AraC family transcriptional regulator [Hyphomicrobiales bacterium]
MVRTLGARVVIEELRRQGLDVERITKAAGLEMRALDEQDTWIPFSKHAQLLEIAAQETIDRFFGLRAASRVDPRDLGAIGYVGLSSRTLADALLNLKRYVATVSDAMRIELSFDDDLAHVMLEPTDPSFLRDRQAIEFAIGGHINGYRFFTQRKIAPLEVQFTHQHAGDAGEHERFLGCPVVFGRNRNQIVLNRDDVALPIESADDRLLKILTAHCDEVLEKRARIAPGHMTRLERCIVDLLPRGQAKAKIVASELGMSERSLVRRLAEAGTSFSEILGKLRYELALKYLRQPELSLNQTAFLLGYANQSAFSTAFKRMTGRTPREMRSPASSHGSI